MRRWPGDAKQSSPAGFLSRCEPSTGFGPTENQVVAFKKYCALFLELSSLGPRSLWAKDLCTLFSAIMAPGLQR